MSNIIKESRQIILNSKTATTYYNNSLLSNVMFQFVGLLSDDKDIIYKTININNAQIPVSFYIINEFNNTLTYNIIDNDPLNDVTINFTLGNYNATTFITLWSSLIPNINISINKLTGIFTFSSTSSFLFRSGTIFNILGFHENIIYNSIGNILIAPFLCDFSGIKRLSIKSTILNLLNRDSNNGLVSSDLQVIPVNTSSYGIIKYENVSNFNASITNIHLNQIDIQIYDEYNNFVDFNGVNWSICLELNIYRKIENEDNKQIIYLLSNLGKKEEVQNIEDIQEPTEEKNNFSTDNDLETLMWDNYQTDL